MVLVETTASGNDVTLLWGHLTNVHAQSKIPRMSFNHSASHPSPWHIISCHFYEGLWGCPGLMQWGWHWQSLIPGARNTLSSHQELSSHPCLRDSGSCCLQKAFDHFFVLIFLWNQRGKQPNSKYEGVKIRGLGRGTVVLTVKCVSWLSL